MNPGSSLADVWDTWERGIQRRDMSGNEDVSNHVCFRAERIHNRYSSGCGYFCRRAWNTHQTNNRLALLEEILVVWDLKNLF